jgi:hypothetical protein
VQDQPVAAGRGSSVAVPAARPVPARTKETRMGIFDKIKDTVADNADKAEDAIDKAADVVDDKTGHKHSDQIDGAAEKAKDYVEKLDD